MGKAKELADFGGVVTVDSGNVGINNASPSVKLDVLASGSGDVAALRIPASSRLINFYRDSANFAVTDASGISGNGMYGITTTNNLAFMTNSTERMRLNSTGALVLAGGNTSANGVGITFPATQSASSDANTLDDYEEGTYTPTITPGSGSLTSYSSSATYIKIGKNVFITVTFTINTAGTAAGTVDFSIPFTCENYITKCPTGIVREYSVTGNAYQAQITQADKGTIWNFTNGPIVWGNGYTYRWSMSYQAVA